MCYSEQGYVLLTLLGDYIVKLYMQHCQHSWYSPWPWHHSILAVQTQSFFVNMVCGRMLTLQLDAHADSICKLSTGTNEAMLCSTSVSIRNVVGCWGSLTLLQEKDATYTAILLLRMSYYSNYSCKWRGMLSCNQQLHGSNCLASTDSVSLCVCGVCDVI